MDSHQHDIAGLGVGKHLAPEQIGVYVLQAPDSERNIAVQNASDIWPRRFFLEFMQIPPLIFYPYTITRVDGFVKNQRRFLTVLTIVKRICLPCVLQLHPGCATIRPFIQKKENLPMPNIIEITDFHAPELDPLRPPDAEPAAQSAGTRKRHLHCREPQGDLPGTGCRLCAGLPADGTQADHRPCGGDPDPLRGCTHLYC